MSCFSPHLCVGFLFLVLHSRLRPSSSSSSSSRLLLLQLAHTQLVHTLVHTQLAHTHTHNLSTHNLSSHNLSTHVHTQLPHATCPHTTCPPSQLVHTQLVHVHFAWQAWHLVTATFSLRGRRGTYGMVGVALGDMDLHFAWHFCVAGVALGDIHLHFAWWAWHLVTSTFAWQAWHPPSICVAGVALMALGWFPDNTVEAAAFCAAGVALGDIHLHFAW